MLITPNILAMNMS